MKFKDFLEYGYYGAATPPGINWPNQHAEMPHSFGQMAQQTQMSRNYSIEVNAVQQLQSIINTIWPEPFAYGATVNGNFPNATIRLPTDMIINRTSMGHRGWNISGPSYNIAIQLGMLHDDGTTVTLYVKPIYDYQMKQQHPINKLGNAADTFLKGVTSGSDPNVQNFRYPGQ